MRGVATGVATSRDAIELGNYIGNVPIAKKEQEKSRIDWVISRFLTRESFSFEMMLCIFGSA